MPRKLSLNEWIEKMGRTYVARELEVERASVCHWIKGKALPRTHQMIKIKKLSRGAVTIDRMVEDYHANKNLTTLS